jgi:tetraprenyl-beta-curcumene synthase
MNSELNAPPTAMRSQRPPRTGAALAALLLANVRYWPNVAPLVRSELKAWEQPALQIGDRGLRALAVEKLDDEGFNAEVAATLATQTSQSLRPSVVRAIVALELLFDYLDGRTELELHEPIADGLRLFKAFTNPLAPGTLTSELKPEPDRAYLDALGAQVHENLFALPSAHIVAPFARTAAERCTQAQTRLHATSAFDDQELQRWAREQAAGSGLAWREHLAGSASSVLAVHALIAAAADPSTTAADARLIDRAYLAIGSVITILDSLVDQRSDTARGERVFVRLFADERELGEHLHSLIAEALARAREAPRASHHVMTLAGSVAFYTTHQGARDPRVRRLSATVRSDLSPTIWPAVAVMRTWRVAKSIGSLACRCSTRPKGRRSCMRRRVEG